MTGYCRNAVAVLHSAIARVFGRILHQVRASFKETDTHKVSGVSRVGLRGECSKSRKLKVLVKVGASKGVTPLIKKKHGQGGFPGNQKTTWIRH